MREDLCRILDKLWSEFVSANADANIAALKLQLTGHLSKDECDLILSSKITTVKFLLMFTLLKSKSEEVLRRIQEICIETEWDELYKITQSALATCENCNHLIIREEEMISHRVKHKRQSDSKKIEPVCFDIRDPTHDFVGRSPQLAELHKLMQQSGGKDESETQKVVISENSSNGLGGIGKTQLALKYIQLFSQHYDSNVVWINAESESTIRDSFQRLAQSLKINTKNVHGKEKDTKYVASDVYAHFLKAKCLFVFDNADKPIQDELYPGGPNKQIYILITSRFQDWGRISVLQLGNFTLAEATEFIKNALKIKDMNDKDKDIVQLSEKLHFFPLAIRQATSYISETNIKIGNIGSSFTIDNYIKMYNEKREDLLNYKFFTDFGNPHLQTMFTTWSITINKIAELKTEGKLALEILNIISYLADEKIEPKVFLQMGNKLEIGSAIEILKQYSMITLEKKMLWIHPLIQEITRLNLKRQNAEEETFVAVCQLIESYFKHLILEQNYGTVKPLMQHIEKILSQIRIWLTSNPSKREEVEKNMKCLLKVMYYGYLDISEERQLEATIERVLDIEKERLSDEVAAKLLKLAEYNEKVTAFKDNIVTILENSLNVQESTNGPDHLLNVETLVQLGDYHASLGDNEKAKQMLERALAIQEKYCEPDHTDAPLTHLHNVYGGFGDLEKQKFLLEKDVAITLTRLGNIYGCIGDYEKQKSLLEKALVIQEKLFGLKGVEAALTLESLGKTYGNLGDSEKKKIFLERALKTQEDHYGSNHFSLARPLMNLGNLCANLGYEEKERTLKEQSQAIKQQGFSTFVNAILLKLAYLKDLMDVKQKLLSKLTELKDLMGIINDLKQQEFISKQQKGIFVNDHKDVSEVGVKLDIANQQLRSNELISPGTLYFESELDNLQTAQIREMLLQVNRTEALEHQILEMLLERSRKMVLTFQQMMQKNYFELTSIKGFVNDTNHAGAPETNLNNTSEQSHSNKSEQEVLVAIEKYINFPDVLTAILNEVYQTYRFGVSFQHTRALHLMLDVMTIHLMNANIQIASSASIFYIIRNITMNSVTKKKVLAALLNAMQHHMQEQTLVRNCCLSLSQLEVPLDIIHDYERAVHLLLRVLQVFSDQMTQSIVIYLLNSLACQVDGHQKLTIGNLGAVEIVLEVISRRVEASVCDEIMEVSWSFLWNVTDETPTNCNKFLNNHGMELFQKCKEKFPDQTNLLGNMMGVMGNIAEVKELRFHLMQSRFVSVFCELLNNTADGKELHYNSAGVLANMISDGDEVWTFNQPTREEASACVVHAVQKWPLDTKRFISYRSLKPILRLLPLENCYASTYWAVWALANLTTVDGPKYCGFIIDEKGVPLLQGVLSNPKTDGALRELAKKVLQNVQDNKGVLVF